jgi:large exoprotein involved in heme utilization and adhesion
VFIGAGSGIITGIFGNSDAGSIAIHGSSLVVDGGFIGTPAGGFDFSSSGKSGPILIDVGTLSMTNQALISASTLGLGQAGAIVVSARNSVTISGGSSIDSAAFGSGDAGSIVIRSSSLVVDDGFIGTPAGGFDSSSGGRSGPIRIDVGTLSMTNQALISASTLGLGQAGAIVVSTRNSVTISGGSQINSSTLSSGNAGSITVDTPLLTMHGGGISTDAASGSSGPGGAVQVSAGTIDLNGGARISASSKGTGDAGSITITASDSFVARDSFVTTEALQANGGDITLHVAGRLVHLINSEITAHAAGNGGNILIDPQFIIVDASKIIASAGINGGNITLVATNGIFISFDSIIDASGALGISGSINISAPTTSLSGTLAPLSQDFMQAATLLSARCAARLSGKSSSFVVAGRDGLPPAPGGLQPSPLVSFPAGRVKVAGHSLQPLKSWQPSAAAWEAVHAGCAG